jgi:hypothetical protein
LASSPPAPAPGGAPVSGTGGALSVGYWVLEIGNSFLSSFAVVFREQDRLAENTLLLPEVDMKVEDLETVIKLWRAERVSEQQAIGKILLLLREIKKQIREIEERLGKLEKGEVARERTD